MIDGARILIVDDDQGMRETLSQILEEEDYLVGCAGSGKETLERIAQDFCNVALIDIKLPDMSGIELLAELKKTSPDTAAILITGYASIETSVEALNLGAEAYIIKPLNIEEVKTRICRALDRQRLVMENRELLEKLKKSNEKLKAEIRKKEALQTKLIQSERLSALGELAAGMSHEINNPLCAILGRTQLLQRRLAKTSSDPKIKEGLDVIEVEGKRIDRILAYLDLYCTPSMVGIRGVDVNGTIEKALSVVNVDSDSSNIKIQKKFDSALPRLMADETGLMHVFMNLLRNTRDAMPNGGTLTISTSRQPESKMIKVVFEDTGEGIPKEALKRVFEPFFTTRDPGKGTGLGLAITYQIVREHGGDIAIESEEGNGTTVTITLPTGKESERSQQKKMSRKGGLK